MRKSKEELALALDDTLCKHVGSLFEYVDHHYDHSNNSYPLAQNTVTSYYVSGEGCAFRSICACTGGMKNSLVGKNLFTSSSLMQFWRKLAPTCQPSPPLNTFVHGQALAPGNHKSANKQKKTARHTRQQLPQNNPVRGCLGHCQSQEVVFIHLVLAAQAAYRCQAGHSCIGS